VIRVMTKIITWNVNGIRACAQKGLFSYMRREDPDIFCLQETKAHPDQLTNEHISPNGRISYFSSAQRKGYSGVATYVKEAAKHIEFGIGIRKFDSEGRFVVTDHEEFLLYNIYFPNGGSGPERHNFKQEFLVRLTDHLLEVRESGREVIVVGDYNVAYLDIDVYDPKKLAKESGFLPEERAWFRKFIDSGFSDAFRILHPDNKGRFTWWSYREGGRIGNRGWRIDHICITPGLAQRLQRAEIHEDVTGSDHCPVLIELK
jgi:exodeoxyribonuclease III